MITEIIKTPLWTNDNGNNMHKAQGLFHEKAWKGSQVRENDKIKDILIQQYLYAQGLPPPPLMIQYARKAGQESKT